MCNSVNHLGLKVLSLLWTIERRGKKRGKKITTLLPDIYQKCTWKRFVNKITENPENHKIRVEQYIEIKDVW